MPKTTAFVVNVGRVKIATRVTDHPVLAGNFSLKLIPDLNQNAVSAREKLRVHVASVCPQFPWLQDYDDSDRSTGLITARVEMDGADTRGHMEYLLDKLLSAIEQTEEGGVPISSTSMASMGNSVLPLN